MFCLVVEISVDSKVLRESSNSQSPHGANGNSSFLDNDSFSEYKSNTKMSRRKKSNKGKQKKLVTGKASLSIVMFYYQTEYLSLEELFTHRKCSGMIRPHAWNLCL
ncbi:hypothetical protein ACFX2B_007303 [Malus domestica]